MKKIIKFSKDDGSVITKHFDDVFVSDDCKYTKVEIGEGIQELYAGNFINVVTDELIIPSTLKEFSELTEDNYSRYGSFSVNEKNPYLFSSLVAIYDKRNNRLVKYANLDKYSHCLFTESVNIIGEYAFRGCNIDNVQIPDTVFTVGDGAFERSSVKTIEFPKHPMLLLEGVFFESEVEYISLPSEFYIGSGAFTNCNNLKVIKYPRSKDRWLKTVDFNNLKIPQGCQVACEDGVISY